MGYAHHDGSISRLRTQLAKVDLIILDDMAIAPIDDRSKEDLLELLDARDGDKVIRRGRPRSDNSKQAVSLRLDVDVLNWFKKSGTGWQTRMNDALRKVAGI